MSGRIFQINTSKGGVPKLATHEAEVGPEGILIDRQRDRRYHGGPERALCIFALERILALQEEGHPIFPGSTGENITTIGVAPERMIPGARLAIGDEVLVEVVSYCSPCRNIAGSFVDGDFNRISQKLHPDWSRVYVRVIETGRVRIGDAVRLVDRD
jgi:MOSC domain-containing protein YiiM